MPLHTPLPALTACLSLRVAGVRGAADGDRGHVRRGADRRHRGDAAAAPLPLPLSPASLPAAWSCSGGCRSMRCCVLRCAFAQRPLLLRRSARCSSTPAARHQRRRRRCRSLPAAAPSALLAGGTVPTCAVRRAMRRAPHLWQRPPPALCPARLCRHAMWAMPACAPRSCRGHYGPLRPELVVRRILVRRVVGPGTYFSVV